MPLTSQTSAEDANALSFMANNPAFLSSDDAAACLYRLLTAPLNTELHWFILKNSEGRHFCAPRIEAKVGAAEDNQHDISTAEPLALAVTANVTGQLTVPSGFTIEASFVARPAKERGDGEATSEWSQRNRFFTIADLSKVMNRHRKFPKCYLFARNGGLLSYTSTNQPFEQELSPRLARDPNGEPRQFENLYEQGAIPSSVWILLSLTAGAVNVVVPGDLWRRRGRLKASWRSDILSTEANVESMPIFGPVYRSAKDVAVYLRTQLHAPAPTEVKVGFILKHKDSDFFIVTEPVSGDYASFDRAAMFPKDPHGNPLIPKAFRVRGVYHSIVQSGAGLPASSDMDLYRNFFSPADLKVGLDRVSVAPHQRLFAVTPDGAVLRFTKPIMPQVQALIAELGQNLEQKILSGTVTPQAYVDKVAAAGDLSVLLSSKTWPTVGKVAPPVVVVAAVNSENAER